MISNGDFKESMMQLIVIGKPRVCTALSWDYLRSSLNGIGKRDRENSAISVM